MKRVVILAVLLTVFPVGTYAKQSIWIDGSPAPDNLYLYPYSVVTIGIYSDNTNAYTDFLELTDGGVDWAPPTHGQWVGNMFIYPEAGADSLVEKDPYGYVGSWMLEAKAWPTSSPLTSPGMHFETGFRYLGGGEAVIKLYEDDWATVEDATVIDAMTIHLLPEPTTIALLGFGVSLLRRRRHA
jgi:hypothetical protein